MTARNYTDKGCDKRTIETPACNSVFATMAGDMGKSAVVHLIDFCAGRQLSALKPPQRKYANRYSPLMKAITFITLFFINFSLCHACECELTSEGIKYYNADIIISGKVLRIYNCDSSNYFIDILPIESFKGKSIQKIKVSGANAKCSSFNTSCDLLIKQGQDWLFFVTIKNGENFTGVCEGSKELTSFSKLQLEAFKKPEISFANVYVDIYEQALLGEKFTPPEFPHLIDSLNKVIIRPNNDTETTSYLNLTIDKNGKLKSSTILKSGGEVNDNEALKAINKLKNWIPGKLNGSPIGSTIIIPIKFK